MSNFPTLKEFHDQLIKDLEKVSILVKNFDFNIFSSHYFINSWIKLEDLDIQPLVKLIDKLHLKDKERDSLAKRSTILFVFNVFTKETRIISVSDFKQLPLGFKKIVFSKGYDFYIPRSVWLKSFSLLNGESLKELESLNSNL